MDFPPLVTLSGGDVGIGQLEDGLRRMRDGNFAVRLDPSTLHDPSLAPLFSLFNQCADRNYAFYKYLHLIHDNLRKLGKKLDGPVEGAEGMWKTQVDNISTIYANCTNQTREISEVVTAVALGDLGKKIRTEMQGEHLELKNTVNTMVDQLSSFTSEVTRVSLEVGTDGKLGGQMQVKGVSGVWHRLTDHVNTLAANLTGQVRAIAEVTTAFASGDLSKKITLDVKGEMLELKNTINIMVDQLSSFTSEVTLVTHELGTEGRLGIQIVSLPGLAGVWKDVINDVNTMSSNLTSQIRSIDDVITSVALGDFSKRVKIEQKYSVGEIGELVNTVNTMTEQFSLFTKEVTQTIQGIGQNHKDGLKADVPGAEGSWKILVDALNTTPLKLEKF